MSVVKPLLTPRHYSAYENKLCNIDSLLTTVDVQLSRAKFIIGRYGDGDKYCISSVFLISGWENLLRCFFDNFVSLSFYDKVLVDDLKEYLYLNRCDLRIEPILPVLMIYSDRVKIMSRMVAYYTDFKKSQGADPINLFSPRNAATYFDLFYNISFKPDKKKYHLPSFTALESVFSVRNAIVHKDIVNAEDINQKDVDNFIKIVGGMRAYLIDEFNSIFSLFGMR